VDVAGVLADLQDGQGELLVIAAHPDDDVIGAGALMARLPRVRVLYVTDGAPRDGRDARAHGFADVAAYAAARRSEAESAVAFAGLPPERLAWLGVADQQATFSLDRLAMALREAIAALQPRVVLTHAYEGGHPDHDATAFAVHAALAPIPPAPPAVARPELLEFAGYHASPDGGRAEDFLPAADCPPLTFELDARARRLKTAMFACHASQAGVLAQFSIAREQVRRAPRYDFSRAPHPGALLYERPGSGAEWGIDGARWRREAAAARQRLTGA